MAGVAPDSPSRSDIFLLLRVAARLSRGDRVEGCGYVPVIHVISICNVGKL